MSVFSSDEDLFRDYDDVAPLSSIFNGSSYPTNSEFDLINGSVDEFFNNLVKDSNVVCSNVSTSQAPESDYSDSNAHNSKEDWNALDQSATSSTSISRMTRIPSNLLSPLTNLPSLLLSAPIFLLPISHRKFILIGNHSSDKPSKSITHFNYDKLPGISSQRCRRFPDILPEDKKRDLFQNTGKQQLWFFILNLLNDFTKKSVIVWTGNQRQFRIKNTELFSHLWSKQNGVADVKWESLKRTIPTCGKNGMLMAVPSMKHKGRNEEGLFGYVIEVSSYLNMTREELDRVIKLHCETGPLTVGSPIDSSFGYPEGTKLQVMPITPLDILIKLPPVPNQPNNPTLPSTTNANSPMQLPAECIDFSQIFNNDFTMNIHEWSRDGRLIPTVVPLEFINQPLPAQNHPLGFNSQPFQPQNDQFQPQNHQLHPMNLQFPNQYQQFHNRNQPFFAQTQPFRPQNEQFDPPF
ncbi:hypothetical protein PRIPAC_73413 [Pristionchus pacificus]|uniref:ETS domain-containing protein n=1 Tax=Pristionchus pacificus TaxID=54126 RepID=A0A2A6CG92_PRIPA|nr:hypothetical protein PRIPAC_73413 [Pristionchus pacificus]|eukprot:PDM77245.1 hypothetical protein PRIPAC_43157 [Pristionchus pacificus]